MSQSANQKYTMEHLLEIMDQLRGENGCPWDKEQTHQSLKPYLIEEAYEVLEAIEKNAHAEMCEELGDLLFQIIFHAQVAKETAKFNFSDIIQRIAEKMIRRHPHVFGDTEVKNSRDVLVNWEKIKQKEKEHNAHSVLEGVPRHLPSLMMAHRLQTKVARVGFDWPHISQALDKVREEFAEFEAAVKEEKREKMEEELGDILFSLVNVARFIEVNPEEALRKTIQKFIARFRYIEESIRRQNLSFNDVTLEDMDKLWEESKDKI
jgi:tetrapyrrole methylase family protein/MazG family protein